MRRWLKQFSKDAIAAFVYYTVLLTPYMVFIMKLDTKQYLAWLVMQAVLVPPLGAGFAFVARKLKKDN